MCCLGTNDKKKQNIYKVNVKPFFSKNVFDLRLIECMHAVSWMQGAGYIKCVQRKMLGALLIFSLIGLFSSSYSKSHSYLKEENIRTDHHKNDIKCSTDRCPLALAGFSKVRWVAD